MTQISSNQPSNKIGLILLISVIIISALVVFNLDFGTRPGHPANPVVQTENATPLRTPRPITPFKLSSHLEKPYTESSLKGQWTLFSFGYTSCPDVCPTALATLSQMDDQLKKEETQFPYQVVFVSVDPERDSLKRLAEYVPYFNSSFLGVTGDAQEIANFTRQMGIMYAKSEQSDSAMGYLVDHSATLILTNPKGEFHAVFSPPHNPRVMANDLNKLVEAETGR